MQYDPTKVPLVDKLLAKFPDEQVAERLSQKYGVSPVPRLTDVHTFKSSMGMGMSMGMSMGMGKSGQKTYCDVCAEAFSGT